MLGIYYVSINFSTLVEINVVVCSLLGIATSFNKAVLVSKRKNNKNKETGALSQQEHLWLNFMTCV